MQSFKYKITKSLEIICIVIFVFITLLGSYQIITRYVFNSPSTISEELLTFSFTWLALLSAALVFGNREHMRMGYVADKFNGKMKVIFNITTELLTLLFSVVIMIYGGIAITKLTNTQITASLGIPMSYIYVIVPISGVLIVIYNIINIWEYITNFSNSNESNNYSKTKKE